MANFETLKTAIDANINTNGKQAITGSVVNNVMHQMVDATSEQLTELESKQNEFINIPFINGYVIGLSDAVVGAKISPKYEELSSYCCADLDCSEGEVYILTTKTNTTGAKAYCVTDADGVVLMVTTWDVTNKKIEIPTNGAKLYINSKKDNSAKIEKVVGAIELIEGLESKVNSIRNIPFVYGSLLALSDAVVGAKISPKQEELSSYCYADLDCSEGEVYILTTKTNTPGAKAYCVTDADGVVLMVETYDVTNKRIEIPKGGVKLYVNSKIDNSAKIEKVVDAFEIIGKIENLKSQSNNLVSALNEISRKTQNVNTADYILSQSGWKQGQKKWLAIGDSFTEINDNLYATGDRLKKGYMTRISEIYPQITYINAGHSGQTMYDAYNFSEIVSGYDIYTILFGTNDFGKWQIGTIEDFEEKRRGVSILGNLGALFAKIESVANGAPILFITSTHWGVPLHVSMQDRTPGKDSYNPCSLGYTLEEMQTAIVECLKAKGKYYVDVFHDSGISPRTAMRYAYIKVNGEFQNVPYPEFLQYIDYNVRPEKYLYPIDAVWTTYDGQHPSDIGMQIFADLIAPKMIKLLLM